MDVGIPSVADAINHCVFLLRVKLDFIASLSEV